MTEKVKKEEHQMLNSPIKWVGGKSRLRKYIIPLLPKHTCYVEPFAGAAWVLFGKPPSDVEILNDKEQELINFFRIVKEKPEDLIASFAWELVSRTEFERQANLEPAQLSDVQRAHRFYYLIMAGWGGELHYPRFQTSITDGGHGNRLFGALKTLRQRLEPIHKRLSTVIIENLDWQDCIDRYDRQGTVMYIDPPYPGNGCNYSHNMRDWDAHKFLADRLGHAQCKWILSSYDKSEIRDLFAKYNFTPIQSSSGMKTEKNSSTRVLNVEILITNFKPENKTSFLSNNKHQATLDLET
ncbi:MAG TPA: DNA adenine methylase [Pyrinomonadaceae bacterium]|jgi:DNA adenine methylase|nr:DNA adenine methylase [Pyrinomonadaceae bacterium]